jgi:transposase
MGDAMAQIQLTEDEMVIAKDLIAHTTHAQLLRRAQALFWLSQGDSIKLVADRLCVSRATIYNWIDRFSCRDQLEFADRLLDAARCGRPRTARGIIDPLLAAVIDIDPRDLGYRQTVWTAALLALHLKRQHRIEVSIPSVRLALDRLGIEWKRPRHDLGRKAKRWRQAKGGSNAGSEAASARSS